MIKLPFKIAALSGLTCLFFACGEESDSVRASDLCPEGAICDTTYVNAKAYSFIYYSGKDKLDTITETTDHISCDIWNGYFECTVRKSYSCNNAVVVASKTGATIDNEKSTKHKKVEVKVGDTTYINYGKHRLINYIPPYHEIPAFDAQKLKDAFDTVVVEKHSYSDERLTGDSRTFLGYYWIEGKGLPDWAYVSHYSGEMVTFDGKDGTPSIDTTIKWMAHYADMYGVEDSLQIETLFRINRKK